ncbi:hypothetical protein KFY34_28385, partial [Salmonella enterica subsp. enterica serovar 1,4,[5],12:i:-]|nr:hypothetical protein [Salmonella enterica subsp. enterica serovar 1,4,[5],12:i:-]
SGDTPEKSQILNSRTVFRMALRFNPMRRRYDADIAAKITIRPLFKLMNALHKVINGQAAQAERRSHV